MDINEVVKLTLQILGQEAAEKMRRELEAMKATYEVLDRSTGTYNVTMRHEEQELDKVTRAAMEATQAHKAMAMMLDEMPGHTNVATAGLDRLIGQGGQGIGQGLMGASYGIQDVITVLAMGGGWGRAMASAANNVTPLVVGLGLGTGLAGTLGLVVTAASAGVMAMEGWWKAADGDKADSARQKLKDIEDQARRTNAEFLKLSQAPTDYEKQAAEGIGLFLKERPNAERARAAVAAGLTGQEAFGKVDAGAYRAAEKIATRSDADILDEGRIRARQMYGSDVTDDVIEAEAQRHLREQSEPRAAARRQMSQMMGAGRQARAEEIVTGATQAGPAGDAARKRLMDLTRGRAGFKELEHYTPERIRADEEAYEADEEQGRAFAERARAGVAARKKAQKEQEQRQRRRAELQHAQTDAALKENARRIRVEQDQDAALATHLQPDAPARATPEQRQVAGQIQREVFFQTGEKISAEQAIAAAKRAIDDSNRAQAEFAASVYEMTSGIGQTAQMYRGMTSRIKGSLEQSAMPSGLQR